MFLCPSSVRPDDSRHAIVAPPTSASQPCLADFKRFLISNKKWFLLCLCTWVYFIQYTKRVAGTARRHCSSEQLVQAQSSVELSVIRMASVSLFSVIVNSKEVAVVISFEQEIAKARSNGRPSHFLQRPSTTFSSLLLLSHFILLSSWNKCIH